MSPAGVAAGIIALALRARTAQRAVPTEIGHYHAMRQDDPVLQRRPAFQTLNENI